MFFDSLDFVSVKDRFEGEKQWYFLDDPTDRGRMDEFYQFT